MLEVKFYQNQFEVRQVFAIRCICNSNDLTSEDESVKAILSAEDPNEGKFPPSSGLDPSSSGSSPLNIVPVGPEKNGAIGIEGPLNGVAHGRKLVSWTGMSAFRSPQVWGGGLGATHGTGDPNGAPWGHVGCCRRSGRANDMAEPGWGIRGDSSATVWLPWSHECWTGPSASGDAIDGTAGSASG